MVTPELIEFVKKELDTGVTRSVLVTKLESEGWNLSDIIETFNVIEKESSTAPINKSKTPQLFFFKNKKKTYKIIYLTLLIILVSAIVFFYASSYFKTSSDLFSHIVNSSRDSKSVNINAQIRLTDSSIEDSKVVDIAMNGTFDFYDKEKSKSDASFSLKSDSIDTSVNVRNIDNSLYIKIVKMPDLGVSNLDSFEDKWIIFPSKSDLGELKNNPLLTSSGFGSYLVNNLTNEQKKHIYDLTDEASFIKVTKKYLPMFVNGSLSYHFDFELDHDGIISYLKKMNIYLKQIDSSNDLSYLKDSDYDDLLSSLDNFHGEMWVGIFDKLPHKVTIETDIKSSENQINNITKFNATIIFKGWGKSVNILTPSGSLPSKEFLSILFGNVGLDNNTNSN